MLKEREENEREENEREKNEKPSFGLSFLAVKLYQR
jgi:hypothetical protein